MSQTTQTLDVIIVGGGMVGGAAALALAKLGLSIAIVEKNASVINTQLPDIAGARVSAIQRSSEKLLKQLGVWEGIETRRITPFTQMHIQDWQGFETQLNAADLHEPNLGYIV